MHFSCLLQDFERFAAGNEQLFAAVGLPREAALAKMRLLALMGLAHGADEVTFQQIQASSALYEFK